MTEGMKGSNTRLCLRSNCTVHSLLLACNFLYSQKQPSAGKGGGVAKVKKKLRNWRNTQFFTSCRFIWHCNGEPCFRHVNEGYLDLKFYLSTLYLRYLLFGTTFLMTLKNLWRNKFVTHLKSFLLHQSKKKITTTYSRIVVILNFKL